MKIQTIIFLLTIIMFCSFAKAQNNISEEIYVESWKEGNKKISNQQIDLFLTPNNSEYQSIITSVKGKQYKLSVIFIPASELAISESGKSTDSWKVELREIDLTKDKSESIGDNLLEEVGIRGGRNNFPRREDLIGYLYPKDKTRIYANGVPFIDGKFYYPIKAKRIIKVEGFYVTILVKDFKLNSLDNHKVDSMEISIELKNAC